jgi:hypothetical protein
MALDGGDPATKVDFRDEVFFGTHRLMPHNYIGKNTTLLGYHLGNDNTIVSDEWYDTRNTKTYMINLKFKSSSKVIFDRNSQDVYSDPGF